MSFLVFVHTAAAPTWRRCGSPSARSAPTLPPEILALVPIITITITMISIASIAIYIDIIYIYIYTYIYTYLL